MRAGWTPGTPVGLPFRGFCSNSSRGRSTEAAVAGCSGHTGAAFATPSISPPLSRRLLLWVSLPGPFTAFMLCPDHHPPGKAFVTCATRLPAGFEVRRFVRVLSRETAALARCPMTGALRLPSAPYPPACAGESDTSPVVLRRPGDICRQAPLPSGLQRPATLRPSDSVGSPFSHSRVESRPEATPVVPVLPG